jgi:hypothetical protein
MVLTAENQFQHFYFNSTLTERANTVSNNVDKDGDQIIQEEQTNRDQEQKKTNCPLNEPEDHSLQYTIFYGWTST